MIRYVTLLLWVICSLKTQARKYIKKKKKKNSEAWEKEEKAPRHLPDKRIAVDRNRVVTICWQGTWMDFERNCTFCKDGFWTQLHILFYQGFGAAWKPAADCIWEDGRHSPFATGCICWGVRGRLSPLTPPSAVGTLPNAQWPCLQRSHGALLFGFSSFGSLFLGSVCLPFPLITQRAHPDIMVFDQVMQICRHPQNPGLGPPKRKEREVRAPGGREHRSYCSKD